MGKQSISRKAWQRAVNVLLWYPDNKAEYAALMDELTTREPGGSGSGGSKATYHDPTAEAAIRLSNSVRFQTIKAEIDAVELALSNLPEDQRVIVERRFWHRRTADDRYRKPRPYDYLQGIGFSERTMHRVCRQVIVSVAVVLGEVRN